VCCLSQRSLQLHCEAPAVTHAGKHRDTHASVAKRQCSTCTSATINVHINDEQRTAQPNILGTAITIQVVVLADSSLCVRLNRDNTMIVAVRTSQARATHSGVAAAARASPALRVTKAPGMYMSFDCRYAAPMLCSALVSWSATTTALPPAACKSVQDEA
jgi:hypothetical protein